MVSFQINEISGVKNVTETGSENPKFEPICEAPDTVQDPVTKQCVAACGEGTQLNAAGTGCVKSGDTVLDIVFEEVEIAIAVGVIVGIAATVFGVFWTIIQRRNEQKKQDLEFIQNFGNQLSEINNEEDELSTKLDCSLYAEKYLDTLEQIATLFQEKLLRRGVAEYFVNNFRYGMNLWTWYKKNVEKTPEDQIKDILDRNKIADLSESDRWYWFRQWCIIEDLKAFESQNMKKIIQARVTRLDKLYKESKTVADVTKHGCKLRVVRKIAEKLEKNPEGLEEKDIREVFENEKGFDKGQVLEYVRRYNQNAENKILPDLMEDQYENIPDENGLSKFEVLETIQKFSNKISEIKEQERKLHTKLDCIVYAEQYLDTMDQLAALYHQKLFPKNAATYFQNSFGYGINILNWYYEYVLNEYEEFDPKKEITQIELKHESKVEDRWIDFRWMCRGQDTQRGEDIITSFKNVDEEMDIAITTEIGNEITLPMTMYQYLDLPEEEGVNTEEISEIMREYSNKLIELNQKETSLKTKMDCAVYAEMYLDVLDQIAYLLNSKALSTDSSTFFENNFSYGLTLKIWYDMMIANADEQESRWSEFLKYCDEFQDDGYVFKILTAFRPKEVLPSAMLFIEKLPEDSTHAIIPITYPTKGKKLDYPKKYTDWEKFYEDWQKEQITINDKLNNSRVKADEIREKWKRKIVEINNETQARTATQLEVKLSKKEVVKEELKMLDEIVYDHEKWLFKANGFFMIKGLFPDLKKREHIQDLISKFIDRNKWIKTKKKQVEEEIKKIEDEQKELKEKDGEEKIESELRNKIIGEEIKKLKEELNDL